MSEIPIKRPDWTDIPEQCPNCGAEFPDSIPDGSRSVPPNDYREGTSEHGDYEEAFCRKCGLILDRTYPENPSANEQDSFCSPDDWVYRAHALELTTSLKRRESQVAALKEDGLNHGEIASRLDISESTVGEYSRRINQRIDEAAETLVELNHDQNVADIIEQNFEHYPLVTASTWRCQACDVELTAGDRATIIFEELTGQWNTSDIFCTECDESDYRTSVHGKTIPLNKFMTEACEHGSGFAIVEATLSEMGPSVDRQSRYHERSLKATDVNLISVRR